MASPSSYQDPLQLPPAQLRIVSVMVVMRLATQLLGRDLGSRHGVTVQDQWTRKLRPLPTSSPA